MFFVYELGVCLLTILDLMYLSQVVYWLCQIMCNVIVFITFYQFENYDTWVSVLDQENKCYLYS